MVRGIDTSLDQRVDAPGGNKTILFVGASKTPPVPDDVCSGGDESTECFVAFLFLHFDGQALCEGETDFELSGETIVRTLPMMPAGRHQKATPSRQIVVVIIFPMYVMGKTSPKPIVVIYGSYETMFDQGFIPIEKHHVELVIELIYESINMAASGEENIALSETVEYRDKTPSRRTSLTVVIENHMVSAMERNIPEFC